MSGPAILTTPRLLLRPWREDDLGPFAALNADPAVMRHFPARLTREESDAMAHRLAGLVEEQGWGIWALERRDTGEFVGFTGLAVPRFALPFLPATEVGWRLARSAWGHGFATEAAAASLDHAFGVLGLAEVVAMATARNARSHAVMGRLGMSRDPAGDFEHPAYPAGHPERPHVLYRVGHEGWRARAAGTGANGAWAGSSKGEEPRPART